MINLAMALKLCGIYEEVKENKLDRREVKVVVDSLIEQLCSHYFHKRPNGSENVRSTINANISKFTENEDIRVLTDFNSMLRSYHDAFSKDYSDHEDRFNDFIHNELRHLVLSTLQHSRIEDDNVKKLKGLLK